MKFDGDRSSFDTGFPDHAQLAPGTSPTQLLILDDNTVQLPDGAVLADATYFRVGDNLVVRSADGEVFIVRDYFILADRPMLVTEDGARLTPEMVDAFAQNHDGVEIAQTEGIVAPGAIAVVIVADGTVTITRQDGTVETATVNTQIFEGDVIETGPDSGVHIIFIDETSIVLSDGGRLSVDDYVFDSEADGGSSVFSVLKGMLAFVSGQIADNDPADVMFNTPVASFGIRGTAAIAEVNPPPLLSSFIVVDGIIYVTTEAGTVELDELFEQTFVQNVNTPPTPGTVITPEEFAQQYAPILDLVPDFFPEGTVEEFFDVNPEAGPNQGPNAPGSEGAQSNDGGTSQFVAFNEDGSSGLGRFQNLPRELGGSGATGSPSDEGNGRSAGSPLFDENGDGQQGESAPPGSTVGTEVVFDDTPDGPPGPFNLTGTPGPDVLSGSNFDDVIQGSGGDDTVTGAGGNDLLGGDAGNDIIDGGPGGDTINGGDGDDLLTGGEGDDVVFGGAGNDTIVAGVGEGDDEYHGEEGVDIVTYTSAINSLLIDMPAGQTTGGPEIGTDTFDGIENATAGAGNDTIIGDGANNRLDGAGGADSVLGGDGDDSIVFDVNDTFADGGAGDDALVVNGGNLDITGIAPGQFTGFEIADLSGNGNNTLILDAASLALLVGPGGSLRVVGDETDQVDIGPGWTITGTQLIDGLTFSVYEQDGLTLLVSNVIDQSNVDAVPTISVSDGVPTPAVEGTDGTITFTITLSGPVNSDVMVDFTTLNGTALAGADFTATSGSVLFTAGQTSQEVVVPVLNDAAFENPEDFTLEISNGVFDPGGADTALIITDDTGAASITDDDPLPTVSISDGTPDPAGESAAGTITFTVTLSNPSGLPITVAYTTLSGTATEGADFAATSGTLTFEPGVTSQDIVVPLLDDLVFEGPETFSVEISNAVQDPDGAGTALTITDDTGTGNIADDEPQPTVSIEAIEGQTDVTEGGVAAFRIFLEGGITSTEAIAVALSAVDGSATGGTDYDHVQFYADAAGTIPLTNNQATIAAGASDITVYVQTTQDLVVEGTEDYSLNIDNVVTGNATIGTASHTANIIEDDVATVSIEAIEGLTNVIEGDVAAFRIFLENGVTSIEDITVALSTINGSATGGLDFDNVQFYADAAGTIPLTNNQATIAAGATDITVYVQTNQDLLVEGTEDYSLNIDSVVTNNAGIGTASHTANIIEDDVAVVSVEAVDGQTDVTEGGVAAFRIFLEGGVTSTQDVTVALSAINGSALGGTDFDNVQFYADAAGTIPLTNNQATIAAGATDITVYVQTNQDLIVEGTEDYSLNIDNVVTGNATIGTANQTANILDDDTATVSIEAIDGQTDVTEGGVAAFRIVLDGGVTSAQDITVALSAANGSALGGTDFDNVQFYADAAGTIPLTNNQATIAAGATDITVYVQTNQDLIVEGTEDYSLNIDNVVTGNATIGNANQTANILDDDTATVSIEAIGGQTDVTEGGVAAFRIFLEGGVTSTQDVTVALSSADGTAIGGADGEGADFDNVQFYADAAGTIPLTNNQATIAAGATDITVYVQTNQDLLVEGTEDYSLNIDSVVTGNADIGTGSQTGNILDDDTATVSIEPIDAQTDVSEGDVAAFRIVLDNGVTSAQDITVALSAADGSAIGGTDFDNVQLYADAAGTILLTNNQATIAAGTTDVTVYVRTTEDLIVEGNEDYSLNISSVVTGNAGIGNGSQTATILDDDVATVSIGVVDGQTDVVEGGVAAFRIFLEGGVTSTEAITVSLASADGTAIGGSDGEGADFDNLQFYSDADATTPLIGNQVTIPAGSNEVIVYVATFDDFEFEPTEDYSLNITGVVSGTASIGDGSQTANILENDTLPPVVDLNGADGGGIDFGPTNYAAGDDAATIVDTDTTVSDQDSTDLLSMTIVLTNPIDGASEILAVNTAGTGIAANYVSATGTLSLTGTDSVANYQAVLRTLTYENTSPAPTEGLRTITVVANDGDGNSSVTAQATVQVDSQPVAGPLTIIHDETPGEQGGTNDVAAIPTATVAALEAVYGVGDLPQVIGSATNNLSFSGGGGPLSGVTFDNITNLSDTTLNSEEASIFFFQISDTLYLGSTDVSSPANAQSTAVFAIHLDANVGAETGSATFVQFQPIDHTNIGDPNDSATFAVDYTVTGTDLDTATNSLTFEVRDDGPNASALVIGLSDVTHDESAGVQNADGADDRSLDLLPGIFGEGAIGWAESAIAIDDSAAAVYGTDGAGAVTLALRDDAGAAFSGNATNLFDTETGNRIFLYSVGANRVVGRVGTDAATGADPGGALAFEIVIEPGTNNMQVAQYRALQHPNPNTPNEGVSLLASDGASALVHIAATASDREGDQSTILVPLGTGSIVFLDDAPAAVADADLNVNEGDIDTAGVNLLANDTLGVDGAAVTSINYTDDGGVAQTAAVGQGGVTVQTRTGALTVASDGSWSFDPNSEIDFGGGVSVTESFTYNSVDGDGDGSSAVQDVVISRQATVGTPGDDTIFGTKGNDTIEGFGGNDSMLGLGSDDLYLFSVGDGNDTVNDSSGNDTMRLQSGRIAFAERQAEDLIIGYGLRQPGNQITVEDHFAANNHEIETLEAADQRIGGYTAAISTGLAGTGGNDLIVGTGIGETINGGAGHDFIAGGGGNDLIDGGNDDDTVVGGAGQDTLDGGPSGFDTAWYFGAPGAITVNLASPNGQVTNDGTGSADTLISIEKIVGSQIGNDTIVGDATNNWIDGRGGNDSLVGAAGSDTYGIHIDGGRDTIDDVSGSDSVVFHGAQLSSAERSGENLILRHSTDMANNFVAVQFGLGNQQVETIVTYDPSDPYGTPTGTYTFRADANGTGTNDFLVAFAGGDSIDGGNGNDWLNGTLGNDTLRGDAGDDVLVGDSFSDSVPGGTDLLDGGEGSDTYHFFGGNFAAGGFDTVIDSGGVADTLQFFNVPLRTASRVDASLVLRYGDNIDANQIVVSNQFTPGDHVEHIKLLNPNDVSNTFAIYDIRPDTNSTSGNDFIVGVGPGNLLGETLFGGLGDDWLNGTNAGNDTLVGGPGSDVLVGMGGDDEYRIGVGDGHDFISEYKAGGNDTLRYFGPGIIWWAVRTNDIDNDLRIEFNHFGSESVVIVDHFGPNGAAVETLTLNSTGYSANIATGTSGTAGNDFIVGTDFFLTESSETLNGGAGDDWIFAGGNGVPGSGDSVVGGEGNDTLVSSEFGSDILDGGNDNDFLSGEAGDNTLLGGAGIDTLDGGGGTDSMDGGTGSDFVSYEFTEGLNGNFSVTIDLANNQATDYEGNTDTLVSIENAIGSIQGDTIIGDAGANTLIGAAGGDTVTGGGGADTHAWRAISDLDFDNDDLIDGVDILTDFSGAVDGDTLDVSQLLSNMDVSAPDLDMFFRTEIDGGDNTKVNLQVDFSGTGTNWQTFATVSSGDGLVGAALETDVDNNINTGF